MGSRFRFSQWPARRFAWGSPPHVMSRFSATRSTIALSRSRAVAAARTRRMRVPTPPSRMPSIDSASALSAGLAHQPGQRLEHRDDHGHDRDRQADEQDAEPDLALRLVAGDAAGARAVDRTLAQLIAPAFLERH